MVYVFDEQAALAYVEYIDIILEHRGIPAAVNYIRFDEVMGFAEFTITGEILFGFYAHHCWDIEQYCDHILLEEGFRCVRPNECNPENPSPNCRH